jgi:UDP-glucose 4-epimerase
MPKQQVISKSPLVPTVLISGGAGFIGSHLAEYLLWNKARVIVLDNFNTGKEIHVKHLLNEPNFALYDVDINEVFLKI